MEKKYNVCKCVYSDIILWILIFSPVIYACIFVSSDTLNVDDNNMYSVLIVFLVIWIALLLGYIIFKLVYGIKNIRLAIRLAINGNQKDLYKYAKKAKYWSIWVFVLNFAINFFVMLILTLVSKGFIIFSPYSLLTMIVVAMTYLDVIFTSIFGIVLIVCKRLNNEVSKGFAIINIILLLCFVFDILDTMYLHFKFRKIKEV